MEEPPADNSSRKVGRDFRRFSSTRRIRRLLSLLVSFEGRPLRLLSLNVRLELYLFNVLRTVLGVTDKRREISFFERFPIVKSDTIIARFVGDKLFVFPIITHEYQKERTRRLSKSNQEDNEKAARRKKQFTLTKL